MLTLLSAPRPAFSARALLLAGLLATALAAAPAAAFAGTSHLRITQASYGATQQLSLDVNKSVIVDLPADVKEVIVSQPAVAPTIMRTNRRAIIQGGGAGSTNIFFLDGAGGTISVLDVRVLDTSSSNADAAALTAALARIIPGSHIVVESFGERVVLSGRVQSGEDLEKATAIATQFTGAPENVANLISLGDGQQVMLRVTVAEVDRDAVRQFGINLSGSLAVGSVNLGFNNQPPTGLVSGVAYPSSATASFPIGPLSVSATLQALERKGVVHTLAEPTLTAISGQQADFLVGGQRAIQTTDQDGKTVLIYKDYGVHLNFTPTVKSDGSIGLVVDTSVSEPIGELDFTQRSAKTSVELRAGETLSIAGLIQDSVRQQINQVPGLGNIPILGALFRSRDFIHNKTELVILVTPCIADTGRPVLPTDNTSIATDAQAIFLGRMENNYGVGHDKDGLRTGYSGSVGFILD